MRKLIQLLVVAIVGTASDSFAQKRIYASDALRLSQTDYSGSARIKGMGNAQIGLGGDVSSVGGNPAGLGMFTRSEVSITPEFNNIVAQADYLGQDTRTAINRGNVNHSALVWYFPGNRYDRTDLTKRVKNFVIGLGVNRTNDFGAEFNYEGTNRNSSIANMYAEQSNGFKYADLKGNIRDAYSQYLTRQLKNSSTIYVPATNTTNNDQSKNEVSWGSTSELNISGAMNIADKFYIGASINYVFTRYIDYTLYNEQGTIIDNKPGFTDMNNRLGEGYDLEESQDRDLYGYGVNARIGMIFTPTRTLKIGVTYQTPTWSSTFGSNEANLNTYFSKSEPLGDDIGIGPFSAYNIRSPFKASAGASMVFGKNILVTADIDYIDYASIKIIADKDLSTTYSSEFHKEVVDHDYLNEVDHTNNIIRQYYTSAVNYRIGAEYKINNFSLRAGYGVNGSPYKDDTDNPFSVKYYSGGLGYRMGAVSVDLAYQRTETTNTSSPYQLTDSSEPIATVKLTRSNVFLTVGVRF